MQFQRPHEGSGVFEAVWGTFRADAAITKDYIVMFDVASTGDDLGMDVITATADSEYIVGVAMDTVADGELVRVQTYGITKTVVTDGTITQGAYIESDASGQCDVAATDSTATAGIFNKLGIALVADTGTVGVVFIRCM